MNLFKRLASGIQNRFAKGAAIAAAAAIGFTAMGDVAQARGDHHDSNRGSLSIQFGQSGPLLAHGGHGGYKLKTECVAKAFRRNGRKLRGTRGYAVRKIRRRACRAAMRECRDRLRHKRHVTGRGFPYARCEVTRANRISVGHRGHHNHGHHGGWGGIVLKF